MAQPFSLAQLGGQDSEDDDDYDMDMNEAEDASETKEDSAPAPSIQPKSKAVLAALQVDDSSDDDDFDMEPETDAATADLPGKEPQQKPTQSQSALDLASILKPVERKVKVDKIEVQKELLPVLVPRPEFEDGPILQLSALASSKKATVPLREIVPREREDDEDEDWDQDQEDRELKDDWSLFNAVPEQADEEKEEKPQIVRDPIWESEDDEAEEDATKAQDNDDDLSQVDLQRNDSASSDDSDIARLTTNYRVQSLANELAPTELNELRRLHKQALQLSSTSTVSDSASCGSASPAGSATSSQVPESLFELRVRERELLGIRQRQWESDILWDSTAPEEQPRAATSTSRLTVRDKYGFRDITSQTQNVHVNELDDDETMGVALQQRTMPRVLSSSFATPPRRSVSTESVPMRMRSTSLSPTSGQRRRLQEASRFAQAPSPSSPHYSPQHRPHTTVRRATVSPPALGRMASFPSPSAPFAMPPSPSRNGVVRMNAHSANAFRPHGSNPSLYGAQHGGHPHSRHPQLSSASTIDVHRRQRLGFVLSHQRVSHETVRQTDAQLQSYFEQHNVVASRRQAKPAGPRPRLSHTRPTGGDPPPKRQVSTVTSSPWGQLGVKPKRKAKSKSAQPSASHSTPRSSPSGAGSQPQAGNGANGASLQASPFSSQSAYGGAYNTPFAGRPSAGHSHMTPTPGMFSPNVSTPGVPSASPPQASTAASAGSAQKHKRPALTSTLADLNNDSDKSKKKKKQKKKHKRSTGGDSTGSGDSAAGDKTSDSASGSSSKSTAEQLPPVQSLPVADVPLQLRRRNLQLAQGDWLDTVVWEDVKSLPRRPLVELILDEHDENMIFEDYVRSRTNPLEEERRLLREKKKAQTQLSKKKKGAANNNNNNNNQRKKEQEEEDDMERRPANPFNISLDRYYHNRQSMHDVTEVSHAEPAKKMLPLYFRPYISADEYVDWHRPKLHRSYIARKSQGGRRRYKLGKKGGPQLPQSGRKAPVVKYRPVKGLQRVLCFVPQTRIVSPIQASLLWINFKQLYDAQSFGDKKVVPQTQDDLSAREGNVVLVEYIEQFPPLLANPGMASRLITYFRKPNEDDDIDDEYEIPKPSDVDGLLHILDENDSSPLILGDCDPGKTLCTMNNSLFSSPLFRHKPQYNDFLLVRDRHGQWFLREVGSVFLCGQMQPKRTIPPPKPNSRKLTGYTKNRLQTYIAALFKRRFQVWEHEVTSLFVDEPVAVVRKQLADVATLMEAEGAGSVGKGFWQKKDSTQLKPKVTPEDICVFESMFAHQRLLQHKGIQHFHSHEDLPPGDEHLPEDKRPLREFIEKELLLAPWNLTANFMLCRDGQAFFVISETLGNPLSARQAFSFSKTGRHYDDSVAAKAKNAPAKLTGTDADLRKLSMEEMAQLLTRLGLTKGEIAKLGRWARVKRIKKLAADMARQGGTMDSQLAQYTRVQKKSQRQKQKDFKSFANEVFQTHCEVLAWDGDPGRYIVTLSNKKAMDRQARILARKRRIEQERADESKEFERFQRERQMMYTPSPSHRQGTDGGATPGQTAGGGDPAATPSRDEQKQELHPGKKRVVRRVKRHYIRKIETTIVDGQPRRKVSTITDTVLVQLKLADEANGTHKFEEELEAREAARLAQLKKSRSKARAATPARGVASTPRRSSSKPVRKSKPPCRACGRSGHQLGGSKCKLRAVSAFDLDPQPALKIPPLAPKLESMAGGAGQSPVVEPGSGLTLILRRPSPSPARTPRPATPSTPRSQALKVKFSRPGSSQGIVVEQGGARRSQRAKAQRAADPWIEWNEILGRAVDALRKGAGSSFREPLADASAYPSSLPEVSARVQQQSYCSWNSFWGDVANILNTHPKPRSQTAARNMMKAACAALGGEVDYIAALERRVFDDRRAKRLACAFLRTLDKIKTQQGAAYFANPVDTKRYPTYLIEIGNNPMDMSTMEKKTCNFQYRNPEAFLQDMALIRSNCEKFNADTPANATIRGFVKNLHEACQEQLNALLPQYELSDVDLLEHSVEKYRSRARPNTPGYGSRSPYAGAPPNAGWGGAMYGGMQMPSSSMGPPPSPAAAGMYRQPSPASAAGYWPSRPTLPYGSGHVGAMSMPMDLYSDGMAAPSLDVAGTDMISDEQLWSSGVTDDLL